MFFRSPGSLAFGAALADGLAFAVGPYNLVVLWTCGFLAVVLSLAGLARAVVGRNWGWLAFALVSGLAAAPIVFLAGAEYSCAVSRACL